MFEMFQKTSVFELQATINHHHMEKVFRNLQNKLLKVVNTKLT